MNFLLDANLPRRLISLFHERGHHAVHALDLPDGNATDDLAVLEFAQAQGYVIATKDSDFTTSFWLNDRPNKLLLISTGNISNKELEALLVANFSQLIADLTQNRFIELSREHIIVHV